MLKSLNNILTQFRYRYSFTERKRMSFKMLHKYPNFIPIIVEEVPIYSNKTIPLEKKKFLVPHDLTIQQFIFILRKRIKLNTYQGLYVYSNGRLLNGTAFMISIYEKYADEDGFLYISYATENTFG